MMVVVKEILTDSENYKAVISKRGKLFEIQLFKYFPECIDEEGDSWGDFGKKFLILQQ